MFAMSFFRHTCGPAGRMFKLPGMDHIMGLFGGLGLVHRTSLPPPPPSDAGPAGRSAAQGPQGAWQKVGPDEPPSKLIPDDKQREWVSVGKIT